MGDLRGFGKPKTFQTKYFLWRILIWLLLNTTRIAGCQAFKTSLAGRLIEAKSQINLNQFSKNMRGLTSTLTGLGVIFFRLHYAIFCIFLVTKML